MTKGEREKSKVKNVIRNLKLSTINYFPKQRTTFITSTLQTNRTASGGFSPVFYHTGKLKQIKKITV